MSTQKNEHNPDNLTPEQYGAPEFRLLNEGEPWRDGDEFKPLELPGDWLKITAHDVEHGYSFERFPRYTLRRRITPPTDTTGIGRDGEAKCNCADGFIDFDCPLHGSQVSPTPETDAAKVGASWIIASHSNGDFVHAELAEKMERQRDTALAQVDVIRRLESEIPLLRALSERLRKELDAALAQVEALRRDGETEGSCLICGHARPFVVWCKGVGVCDECRSGAQSCADTKRDLDNAQQWIDSEPDWKERYNANYLALEKQRDDLVELIPLTSDEAKSLIECLYNSMSPAMRLIIPQGWNVIIKKLERIRDAAIDSAQRQEGR